MELVYLWVEDYKNIQKQGFNFSPNFDVKFTPVYEDERLSDKSELEITPKENPLKDFFGKDINVTAIVGENGSGKSSLSQGIIEDFIYIDDAFTYIKERDNFFFTIYFDEKENKWFKYDNKINVMIKLIFNKTKVDLFEYQPTIIMYSSAKNLFDESIIKNINVENNIYRAYVSDYFQLEKASNYSIDNANYMFENFYDIMHIKNTFTIKQVLNFIFRNKDNFKQILPENYNIPKYVNISYFLHHIRIKYKNKIEDYLENKKDDMNIKEKYFKIFAYNQDGSSFKEIEKKCLVALMVISILDEKNIREEIEQIMQKEFSDKQNPEEYVCNLFDKLKKIEQFNIFYKFNELYEQLKNKENINEIYRGFRNRINIIDNFEILGTFIDEYRKLILKTNLDFLNFNFFPKQSSGEMQLIELIASIDDKYNEISNKDFVLLILDEADIFLHPNWNRQLINIFLTYLNKFIGVHLLITSHSPFILSDLPKENVIFLEKGKQVYPFDDGKQTFGANIHTLLSHGFFMKDGLMGEFAKDKIDLAITYLNQKTLTQEELDYCENIISIIGEPIIKRELQRMLKNKMELSNKTEIDTIKQEIKLLTKRLEDLEKDEK